MIRTNSFKLSKFNIISFPSHESKLSSNRVHLHSQYFVDETDMVFLKPNQTQQNTKKTLENRTGPIFQVCGTKFQSCEFIKANTFCQNSLSILKKAYTFF